ncbi:MAG: class I SAM-dependent methyltransferase, partial [Spirochaetaceae bacterium]|nr:class I SAM-dependent methyltransferase [Spirochaetaceae bacterium]
MSDLGPRLESALAFLVDANCLADVGADHGFFAIEAIKRGLAKRAVAIDDKPAPLERATEHIAAAGLAGVILPILADGLPREVACDTVAILGLGGITIAEILGAADLSVVTRLILGPQSEPAATRLWLEQNGFKLVAEAFVRERGKHYQILAAVKGTMTLSEAEREFGPLILEARNPAISAYVAKR